MQNKARGRQNFSAALFFVTPLGLALSSLIGVFSSFKDLPHESELVVASGAVNATDVSKGVQLITMNDHKFAIPAAAERALRGSFTALKGQTITLQYHPTQYAVEYYGGFAPMAWTLRSAIGEYDLASLKLEMDKSGKAAGLAFVIFGVTTVMGALYLYRRKDP